MHLTKEAYCYRSFHCPPADTRPVAAVSATVMIDKVLVSINKELVRAFLSLISSGEILDSVSQSVLLTEHAGVEGSERTALQ